MTDVVRVGWVDACDPALVDVCDPALADVGDPALADVGDPALADVGDPALADVCDPLADPCVAAAVRFSWTPGGHLQLMHLTASFSTLYSVQLEHLVHRPRSTPRGSFISLAVLTQLGGRAAHTLD